MKDLVKRTIRVGDYCLGMSSYETGFCYVVRITNKLVYTNNGRYYPGNLLVLNDIPIEQRVWSLQYLDENYPDISINFDQLPMEWEIGEKND